MSRHYCSKFHFPPLFCALVEEKYSFLAFGLFPHSLKEPEAQNFPLNSGKFLNPLSIRKPSLDAGGSSIPSSTTSSSKPLDVEELEMLLEAYFVQIEGTLNKLSSVSLWLKFPSFHFFFGII